MRGKGLFFIWALQTDSFISQSNLAVCAQAGGQGGSGGTWYQAGSDTGQGVRLCACVVCKPHPLAPRGLKSRMCDPTPSGGLPRLTEERNLRGKSV